jgi:hypothetical protein
MRATKFQGTAGYVTRMSGGVGGGGREVFPYPDRKEKHEKICSLSCNYSAPERISDNSRQCKNYPI